MDKRQIKFLSLAEDYIKKNNKKGNERTIVEFSHRIEKYDLATQERYINMLCESDYPITAAIAIKSLHHEEASGLRELIIRKSSTMEWPLFHKIVTLVYLDEYKKITEIIDETNDIETLNASIDEALEFLVSQSEYKYIFGLFYSVAKCEYSSKLFYHFISVVTREHYINQNFYFVQEGIQSLYEKKDYDALFYICKKFNLHKSLKKVLQKDPKELEDEFLGLDTINGVRLAFRVLQSEMQNDEKAYITIISKIREMRKSDELQYIYFCYILKLIILQNQVSEDVKELLLNIGEVKLLKKKVYGINLLAECLESILINTGMKNYNKLVQALGVNNIFEYKKEVPDVIPYTIYKALPLESISDRKKHLSKIRNEENLDERKFINFYMNSFYRYLLSITDFFSILYEHNEDRVYLRRKFGNYDFYGKVYSVDYEKRIAKASFQNIVSNTFVFGERNIGVTYFDLLKPDDEFSCSLERYNPESRYVSINDFRFIDQDRHLEYEDAIKSHWEALEECFEGIISKEELTPEDIEEIESVPYIKFKELNDVTSTIDDYANIYSEVLRKLKDRPEDIVKFIKALSKNNNNLFSINDNNSNFLSISRTDKILVSRAEETVQTLIDNNLRKEDLIWIYLNSYLRLVLNIQAILKSIKDPNLQLLELGSIFKSYRFYGELNNITTNRKGRKIGYVNSISMRSSRRLSFFLDKEQSITEDMFDSRKMISFGLSKYLSNGDFIEIEDIWVQGKEVWNRNWADIHSCHEHIKLIGTVKKETLKKLSKIPEQKFKELDFKRLLDDFNWCMNNLCYEKNILFDYIVALDKNNPYKYTPDESKATSIEINDNTKAESNKILRQLIQSKNNLYKIVWVYLNSYLSNYISIDDVLKEYYNSFNVGQEKRVQYLTGIVGIEFMAKVDEISEGQMFLHLTKVPCQSRLFLQLDDTDYNEKDFNIGEEVKIILVEYNQDKNTIGVELC